METRVARAAPIYQRIRLDRCPDWSQAHCNGSQCYEPLLAQKNVLFQGTANSFYEGQGLEDSCGHRASAWLQPPLMQVIQ